MTSWENPVEIAGNWSEWSPLDGARGARHQLLTIFREGIKTLTYLKNADALGLLMCGWLILPCLYMKSGFPIARHEDAACLWACVTVGVYAGGYAMIYSEQRFLWAVWGIMLAAAIAALARLGGKSDGLQHAAPAPDSTASSRRRLARNCLAGIVLASISYNVLATVNDWRGPSGLGRDADWVRDASRAAVGARQCASNDWYTGLYSSFWARTTFLGRIDGRSAEAVARELLPYGDTRVLVYEDSALSRGLSESPVFSRVADSTNPVGRRQLAVFDFHPSPEPAR